MGLASLLCLALLALSATAQDVESNQNNYPSYQTGQSEAPHSYSEYPANHNQAGGGESNQGYGEHTESQTLYPPYHNEAGGPGEPELGTDEPQGGDHYNSPDGHTYPQTNDEETGVNGGYSPEYPGHQSETEAQWPSGSSGNEVATQEPDQGSHNNYPGDNTYPQGSNGAADVESGVSQEYPGYVETEGNYGAGAATHEPNQETNDMNNVASNPGSTGNESPNQGSEINNNNNYASPTEGPTALSGENRGSGSGISGSGSAGSESSGGAEMEEAVRAALVDRLRFRRPSSRRIRGRNYSGQARRNSKTVRRLRNRGGLKYSVSETGRKQVRGTRTRTVNAPNRPVRTRTRTSSNTAD